MIKVVSDQLGLGDQGFRKKYRQYLPLSGGLTLYKLRQEVSKVEWIDPCFLEAQIQPLGFSRRHKRVGC